MKASAAGRVECVKVLLDRGAEVNKMQSKVSGVDVNPLPMHRMKNATNYITYGYNEGFIHLIIMRVPFNGHYMCGWEY